nr:hypothetical protein [Tanacetum cinerariifolium]
MSSIDDIRSILTQSGLDALCKRFHIPPTVHPELPCCNSRIHNSLTDKIGVYTSYLLLRLLRSHFEILCRVHGFVPTVGVKGEREVAEGEVLLLQLTRGRVVPLAGANDQENANVQGAGEDNMNEGSVPSEDPSSDHIPPLPAISPFLSSIDDSSNINIPDTPPSPTHGTPFTETTLSTQRSPAVFGSFRRRVMVLAPGQPIPHGRPYCYHLNGPVHMMTARKRVRPLPTHHLVVRHSVDYSSLDHFASDDSLRDSSSSSSLETSSNSYLDDLSDPSSDHSLPTPSSGMRPGHHLCSLVLSIPHSSAAIIDRPSHDSSSTSPSRKRSRSPAASVPLSSPILRALSYARADLLPSPKRIMSSEFATDLEG